MKSRKTAIPADSLTRRFPPADYADAFACDAEGGGDLSADDVLIALWTAMPGWVNALFGVRNALVRLVGLRGGGMKERADLLESTIRGGGSMDMVSVAAKSDRETVLKLSDKHLDALMSVHIARAGGTQTVTAITSVYYHNLLGRIYFFLIRPFHKPIVKSMLKSTLKNY